MSNVWFTSDLHFGHKNIHKFREGVDSEEENRHTIIRHWNRLVTKRDDVYILGDVAFNGETLTELSKLLGRKFLVRGNHDDFSARTYLQTFEDVFGLKSYKGFWLSHAPIHPNELRYKVNIHGHVHSNTIPDKRYFNVSVDNLWAMGYPSLISLDQIRNELNK